MSPSHTPGQILRRLWLVLFLGIFIFVCYRSGYVPVIGKKFAKAKLGAYVTIQMPGVQIETIRYDWYNATYIAGLSGESNLLYNLKRNTIHDEAVGNQINLSAKTDYKRITKQFSSDLTLPDSIWIWTSLSADDYAKKAQRLYVLGIYNTADLTEEQSLKKPAEIAKNIIDLMGPDYNFTGIQLTYADKNGLYEIIIPSDSFNALTGQELLQHTKKTPPEKLPEDYIEWLNQQGTT